MPGGTQLQFYRARAYQARADADAASFGCGVGSTCFTRQIGGVPRRRNIEKGGQTVETSMKSQLKTLDRQAPKSGAKTGTTNIARQFGPRAGLYDPVAYAAALEVLG